MSKISLEPNASGAGTFSIVSPDSNTNRTLNLPDEAGTILSDASTIDSNNLQSDVYKQDNIVSTVSESGGVPTGGIIERGSNSNGEFVRYADGTMICSDFFTLDHESSSRCAGSITFPATFAGRPSVTVNNDNEAAGTSPTFTQLEGFFSIDLPQSTGISRLGYNDSTVNFSSGDSLFCSYIAFGRWY